eukprot:SM000010S04310  [mRNA]  locus=s10:863445:863858:- [translate_table: standard]
MQGVGHGPLKGDGPPHTRYLSPRASGVEVSRLTAPAGHSAPRKPGQQDEPLGPESPVHVHGQGYELISSRVVGVFGRRAASGLRHSVASPRGREPRVGAVDHISGDPISDDVRRRPAWTPLGRRDACGVRRPFGGWA